MRSALDSLLDSDKCTHRTKRGRPNKSKPEGYIIRQGDFYIMTGMSLLFIALFDAVLNKLTKMDLLYLGSVACRVLR